MVDICIEMKKTAMDIFLAAETGVCHNHYWVNRIPAMAPYTAPSFWGANYKETYLPQNRVHSPRLEGER